MFRSCGWEFSDFEVEGLTAGGRKTGHCKCYHRGYWAQGEACFGLLVYFKAAAARFSSCCGFRLQLIAIRAKALDWGRAWALRRRAAKLDSG